jgi:hypothetical protein
MTDAERFVVENEIAPPPPADAFDGAKAAFDYDAAKDQAAVVGSDIIAFVKGVTEQDREDITNVTLFAQQYAKKHVPAPTTMEQWATWYGHYFDALSALGFVAQSRTFDDYEETTDDFEAHEAIIGLATTLLAGTPGAVAVIIETLTRLKEMKPDSSWMTLFDRESRSANTARFQATLANRDANGDLLVSLVAFSLEAEITLVQVLFFKFRKNEVRLRKNSTTATISRSTMASARDKLVAKLATHAAAMIDGLDL